MSATLLLQTLAEQIKMPLLQVSVLAELAQTSPKKSQQILEQVSIVSRGGLALIDAYLMAAAHEYGQLALPLQPVSISSTLKRVSYLLEDYARIHNFDIELSLGGKFEPVMANAEALSAAVFSLAHSFFDSDGIISEETSERPCMILGTHRVQKGIAVGVYLKHWNKGTKLQLQKSKVILGKASQPLAQMSPSSGAGVFIADALVRSMDSVVRAGHHNFYGGLALTLIPSQQLSLF